MRINDESILLDDKLVFVSLERFKEKIFTEGLCFICADENSAPTDEHIIPKWILRKYSLFNKTITLPNGTTFKYRDYVVPCCLSCNKLLNKEFETPISSVCSKEYVGLNEFLKNDGRARISCWLALIYIKMHYMDNFLRADQDRRKKSESIAGDLKYDWGKIHHIYCLARSYFSNANLDSISTGSLALFPLLSDNEEQFDVSDFTFASTLGLRIGSIGLIACFDDGGAVFNKLNQRILEKIEGKLSYPQFRELIAVFACCRLHLQNPPIFSTLTNNTTKSISIVPTGLEKESVYDEFIPEVLGNLMMRLLYESTKDNVDIQNYKERLSKGEISFLFANDGSFIKND